LLILESMNPTASTAVGRFDLIARVVIRVSGIAALEDFLAEAWTAEGLRLPRHEIASGREVHVVIVDPLGDTLFSGKGSAHEDSRGGCRVEIFSVCEAGQEILDSVLQARGGAASWNPRAARDWVAQNRMPVRSC
jgi:hypothetical protein